MALSGVSTHPFHSHVNSIQILHDPPDTFGGYFLAGDWHDVLITPNYQLDVRMQADRFTGQLVFHCHDLQHEDLGMMGVVLVTGEEGTVYKGAEAVDPTCFRDSQYLAPKVVEQGTCGSSHTSGSPPSGSAAPGTTGGPATTFCFEAGCQFSLSFRASPYVEDHTEITLSTKALTWLGVGVSPDGRMGPDAVAVVALFRESGVETHVYALEGHTPEEISRHWLRMAEVESTSRESGTSTMVFNMPFTDRCDSCLPVHALYTLMH